MEPRIFEKVEDMISLTGLKEITGNTIGSVDRDKFQNEGFSGNNLERLNLTTSGGQVINLILKHFEIKGDWLMRLTHDDMVREVALYQQGIYQQLPSECLVPILAAARENDSWATLMPDVSEMLLPSGDVSIPENEIKIHIDHVAAIHAKFMGDQSMNDPELGLCSEQDWIMMLSPAVGKAEVDAGTSNDISGNLAFAWDTYWNAAPSEAVDVIKNLQADLSPLLKALDEVPRTFLHGDYKYANIGSCVDCFSLLDSGLNLSGSKTNSRTIMLDWGLAMYSSPLIEIGWFLAINSAKLSVPKEEVIQMYRHSMASSGYTFDNEIWIKSLDLGLLAGGALRLIWAKALGTLSDDHSVKERETAEVKWWSEQVIRASSWLQ